LRAVLPRLLAIALPLHFAWEMLQMPGFAGLPESWLVATAVCALAAIGDVVIALALFVFGVVAFRNPHWFEPPRIGRYAAIVAVGVILQAVIEWVAVYRLRLWTYRDVQPIVPPLGVGILAILQPVILLPLTFWLLGKLRRARASSMR
jgi:hypothetical protein